jgi:hypothetical protein
MPGVGDFIATGNHGTVDSEILKLADGINIISKVSDCGLALSSGLGLNFTLLRTLPQDPL